MWTIKHKTEDKFIINSSYSSPIVSSTPEVLVDKNFVEQRLAMYKRESKHDKFFLCDLVEDYEVVEVTFNTTDKNDNITIGKYVKVKKEIIEKILSNKQKNYEGFFETISWDFDDYEDEWWFCCNTETKACINILASWLELSGHIKI